MRLLVFRCVQLYNKRLLESLNPGQKMDICYPLEITFSL